MTTTMFSEPIPHYIPPVQKPRIFEVGDELSDKCNANNCVRVVAITNYDDYILEPCGPYLGYIQDKTPVRYSQRCTETVYHFVEGSLW